VEKRTTIVVPVSIRDRLTDLKEYERQPMWVVIKKLLEVKGEW